MTRMTGPDCVVMCNLINTYIHTYILPREDQCVWHRMTRMTGPDCVVMCNLINTYYIIHTYIHTYIRTYIHVEINKEAGGGAQGTLSLSKNCTSRESVSPLSRLIRGFRNKYH